MTDEKLTEPVAIILACFLSISVYNVFEVIILIFTTFKRWQGLYFYSLLAATGGIISHSIGMVLKLYQLSSSNLLYNALILIGWSLVLYSRLYLLRLSSKDKARWVLYMIIADGIVCHTPGFVLVLGSANASDPTPYTLHFHTYEKSQLSIFFTQECFISGLYIYRAIALLRLRNAIKGHADRLLRHLLLVNIIIMIMDASLLGIEFAGFYNIETAYKSFVYSAKLKMEFAVLNDLMDLFRGGSDSQGRSIATGATPSSTPTATRPALPQQDPLDTVA
ncbi:hypothetical protein P280DRAFT_495457 [Massarina eburnea CBS 473.64]|uniref:DUF7703 domain-containing protein n=1 Tax=Massarina eburnea CBS 473.64 TaxID=1395130 RepID=A0A6A6SGU6_9PLEO|nr:hypothetical protein P280DRAFT_495457 [Massarina eburnea CBS 473.64]